jgi:molecular chaperone GrpE
MTASKDNTEKNKNEVENLDDSVDSLKMPGMDDLEDQDSAPDTADEVEDVSPDTAEDSEEESEDAEASELKRLEEEAKENYQKYLYAMAEIDNMKKRHIKERSELLKYNGENIARDMLEILDDLERSLEQGKEISSDVLFEGLELIASRMRNIFERHQVKVDDAIGKMFDPAIHEALTAAPSKEVVPGTVLHQLKKAYFFKDKLLRPAQVVVASEDTGSDSGS